MALIQKLVVRLILKKFPWAAASAFLPSCFPTNILYTFIISQRDSLPDVKNMKGYEELSSYYFEVRILEVISIVNRDWFKALTFHFSGKWRCVALNVPPFRKYLLSPSLENYCTEYWDSRLLTSHLFSSENGVRRFHRNFVKYLPNYKRPESRKP
jgi:hypothetical protein